jgi:hypothetical protein
MKLLIDTGCYGSIIRPSIAEQYYPSTIFQDTCVIKTATGQKKLKYKADIPAFDELKTGKTLNFMLYDFHEFFDGIIGTRDLLKMKFVINLAEKLLTNKHGTNIPLYYRKRDETLPTFSIDAHELIRVRIPVDCFQGDIVIQEQTIHDAYIPETLTTANNGYALCEIHNNSNKRNTFSLNSPLKVVKFPDSAKENFEFYNIYDLLSTKDESSKTTLKIQ